MTPKQPATMPAAVPDATAYAEERIPFDQALRKLVSAKPVHKAAGPVKRTASKPPKKVRVPEFSFALRQEGWLV